MAFRLMVKMNRTEEWQSQDSWRKKTWLSLMIKTSYISGNIVENRSTLIMFAPNVLSSVL